jgi:hypothetical protein
MENKITKSAFVWLTLSILAILGLTFIGPSEKILGTHVRIVYLHGAWVWTSLAAFVAAGICGFIGLVLRSNNLQYWSRALGRTGLFFWVTYLPISMWAMQANWNGLFLAEPRFRIALIFAVVGLLIQGGVTLLEKPAWAAALNILYVALLIVTLVNTPNIMHPPSPILNSDARRIQIYFAALCGVTFLAAWQIVRLGMKLERQTSPTLQK